MFLVPVYSIVTNLKVISFVNILFDLGSKVSPLAFDACLDGRRRNGLLILLNLTAI